jgi:hypothetical protein
LRRDEDGIKQAEAISGDEENRASGMTLKVGIKTGHERGVEHVSLVSNAIKNTDYKIITEKKIFFKKKIIKKKI